MPNVKIRVEAITDEEYQQKKQAKQIDTTGEKLAVASIFAHQAMTTAKQITGYAISNIGNFTGDYVKQDQIERSMALLGDLATIGASLSNPVTAVVAVLGIATKHTLNAISEYQSIVHTERDIAYLKARSGNSTKNGSRTGD